MAEQIETSLELVGATAIEDKLQESGWQIETLKKLQLVAGVGDGAVSVVCLSWMG